MAKQETLTLFPEVEIVTRKMTDAQFGSLIRAVMAYRFRGEAYAGDDIAVDIAFQFISSQVDRSETAKAEKTIAAKKRWSVHSDADPMQSDAGCMQNHAEGMHSDADPMQSDAPILSSPILSSPILSIPDKKTADSPPAPARQAKKSFGVYGWVKLTDDEFNRLINDLGEAEANRCIAYVDESAQGNGNKNKWRDWNLVLRKCSREGWGKQNYGTNRTNYTPGGRKLDEDEVAAIRRMMEG